MTWSPVGGVGRPGGSGAIDAMVRPTLLPGAELPAGGSSIGRHQRVSPGQPGAMLSMRHVVSTPMSDPPGGPHRSAWDLPHQQVRGVRVEHQSSWAGISWCDVRAMAWI
jgi:hypothetical protein